MDETETQSTNLPLDSTNDDEETAQVHDGRSIIIQAVSDEEFDLETSMNTDASASQWESPRVQKGGIQKAGRSAWGDEPSLINGKEAMASARQKVAGPVDEDSDEHIHVINAALFHDDWEDDDDVGYIYVHLSEEEFFELMEEVRWRYLLFDRLPCLWITKGILYYAVCCARDKLTY